MSKKILVVDDNRANLEELKVILKKDNYITITVEDAKKVRASVLVYKPDLVLMDVAMPEISGFELCERLLKDPVIKNIPIILVMASYSLKDIARGFQKGAVDYITKPFNKTEVRTRVALHLKIHDLTTELENKNKYLQSLVKKQVKKISKTQMETIFSLAKLAQSRDDETGRHLERVQKYCYALSVELSKTSKFKDVINKNFIKNIVYASPLHDIGKVSIPDSILLKPGKLTPDEYDKMKLHTIYGAETLEDVHKKFGANEFIEMEEIGLEEIPTNLEEFNILDAFNQFIKNKICTTEKNEKFKIYNINICYKINDFMTMEEKIQEIKKEIYKINNEKFQIIKNRIMGLFDENRRFFYNPLDVLDLNVCQGECCERYHVLSDIIDEKSELEKKLKALLEETKTLTKKNFSGVIFVTFNTIEEHENFLKPFPKNFIMTIFINIKNLKYFLCCCFINKNKRKNFFLKRNITVDAAPEPEDVIFENLQCSSCERFVRTLFIYIFSLIIIAICFVVILFLNYFQTKRNKKNGDSPVVKYGLSIAISLVISILNAIFLYILESLTKKERQISMTNFYLSFSIKLTLFTFFTSAVIPLISNYFFSKADYNLLVTNMLMLFITNAFLTPIMWSMKFEYLLKKVKICLLKRNQETYTQKELNELYELLDMSIASKYSYIFKTLLMSFLYMPIFPLSIVISLVGFVFGYFVEKFNFSHMYKRPENLNSKICEFYSNYFPVNFLMLTVGDFIFLNEEGKTSLWSILNVIIFASLIIIPYNQIFDFDFIGINESEISGDQDYEECYFTFFNDYEKTNPMTKKEGIKNFMLKLEKDGLISRSEYSKIIANFDNANLMETYYKARKNIGNSMAQQSFVNMGNLGTMRKKTTMPRGTSRNLTKNPVWKS